MRVVEGAFTTAAIHSSIEEGEEYICRNCDAPEKPCVDDPLFECPEMILGGTQLESVRERSGAFMKGESPRCALCGRKLSAAQLRHSPLSELCPGCRTGIKNGPGCHVPK